MGNSMQNQQPQAVVTTQPDKSEKENSQKMIMFLIIGIIVAIVIAILIYKLMGKETYQQTNPSQSTKTNIAPSTQTNSITTDSLTKDLEGVQVEELDTQFTEVDKDLQSL